MPPVPAAGIPLSNPEEVKVTPLGKRPLSLKVAAGSAVAVTWNEPRTPTLKVALLALVIVGARFPSSN